MHACKKCHHRPLTTKQQATVERDQKKMRLFKEKGYRVVTMWECEWDRKLPSISSTPTRMGKILLRDNEQTLLNAIRQDDVFGFAVCSVETPQALIDEFEKVS